MGRVSFLINRWSCSIVLLRYLTCRISISQNHPYNNSSSQLMFCNPARFAPLLSMTTFSGQPLVLIVRAKKALAAAKSLTRKELNRHGTLRASG